MNRIFFIFFLLVMMLQIEIIGLVYLHWGDVQVWKSQVHLNNAIIDAINIK